MSAALAEIERRGFQWDCSYPGVSAASWFEEWRDLLLEFGERCPRCKKRHLAQIVVHGKGTLVTCQCGYEGWTERIDQAEFERKYWRWKDGLSPTALTFRGVEALLQSIYEMRVCTFCAEHAPVEQIREQAMNLEHERSYLAQGDVYSEKKMQAYLHHVVAQLREVGSLCEACWQEVLQETMRRYYGLDSGH